MCKIRADTTSRRQIAFAAGPHARRSPPGRREDDGQGAKHTANLRRQTFKCFIDAFRHVSASVVLVTLKTSLEQVADRAAWGIKDAQSVNLPCSHYLGYSGTSALTSWTHNEGL